ncbi:MAG: porin [Blastocatellales bacterium]
MCKHLFIRLAIIALTTPIFAQAAEAQHVNQPSPDSDNKNTASGETPVAAMLEELRLMRQTIEKLEARVSQLEAEKIATVAKPAPVNDEMDKAAPITSNGASKDASTSAQTTTLSADDRDALDFWRDTTVNVTVDGYYGYNFNRPLGGINLLRAYDVLSNSFSLNQAGVIFEQAPKVKDGRRFGARLDLMFGQATETLQGSAVNELRPQVYRHIWQAYGTYVAPLGNGLTVDFGKFASALGYETNYTKDNFNYSRSYWFLFLPFYHFGFRAAYPVNEKLTATYWLVNGAQQTEDFNAWKSQAVLLTYKPTSRITAQANYYSGPEQRVRTSILNPTFPVLPTQPGLSPVEIRPEPDGRFHALDAYATINATDKLTFAFQGDYVITRTSGNSPPSRVTGGAAYARYQFSQGFALASRFEYLSDRRSDPGESLFTGLDQALKEVTMTAEYKFGEGFLLRGEYRRDWSNKPFFLTATPGVLKKEQNTATLGLVWWFGRKKGAW